MKIRQTVSKSSVESFGMCQQKYFMENILSFRGEGGLKADIGSAVHAVMEYLALIKKASQTQSFPITIENDELGTFTCDQAEWEYTRVLNDLEIAVINKSRVNKGTYVDQVPIKSGYVRRAETVIARLEALAKAKFLDKHDMTAVHVRDFNNYIWMTLEQFDIFNANIIDVEFMFDIELPFDWAKDQNGQYVRMKGFIDLITEPAPGVFELVDYKTGRRGELLKDDKKTYKDMKNDLQLAMYTYVVNQLFPDKFIMASLLFIRDGGLYTITNEEYQNREFVEFELKRHFEEVRNCKVPRLLDETRNHFVCKYMCPAAKAKTFSNNVCDCQFIKSAIAEMGIDTVTTMFHKDKFSV